MKGRPKDKTLEKTIQQSWKYNSTSMHLSETKLEKEKVELQGLIRPQHKDIWKFQDFQNLWEIFVCLLGDSL